MKTFPRTIATASAIFAVNNIGLDKIAPDARGKSILALDTSNPREAELLIYGPIGEYFWGDGVSAAGVVARLAELSSSVVNVRINSDGGVVTDGLAIYNALVSFHGTVNVTIDGVAASIASLIAMAGKTRRVYTSSLMMIHGPQTASWGFADDLRETADTLDTFAKAMKTSYVARAKRPTEIAGYLVDRRDHWFTAMEMISAGLADEIVTTSEEAAPTDAAATAALLSCIHALSSSPGGAVSAFLQRRIQNTVTASSFASLREAHQRQVFAHIKEPTMRHQLSQILAHAGSGPAAAQPAAPAAAADPFAALRSRNTEIRGCCEPFYDVPGIRALESDCLADPHITIDQVRAKLLQRIPNGATPVAVSGFHAGFGHADATAFREGVIDALLIRAGLRLEQPHAASRDFRHMPIAEIARASLVRAGSGRPWHSETKDAVIRAAMTTSDFPFILENALHKGIRHGMSDPSPTHRTWCRISEATDFRPQSRVLLGAAPGLKKVLEGGEYERGQFMEDRSSLGSVEKFGRIVSLSFEALANDDLSQFLGIAPALGRAALQTEADEMYDLLTQNNLGGVVMQDTKQLFHADHINAVSVATGAGKPLTAAALSAARAKLRRQVAVGGGKMNLAPRYLLVPPERESEAEILVAASTISKSQAASDATTGWLTSLVVIAEPRLANTDTIYVLAANNAIDTGEIAVYAGSPIMSTKEGFETDDRAWKINHAFTCGILDFRGFVKLTLTAA